MLYFLMMVFGISTVTNGFLAGTSVANDHLARGVIHIAAALVFLTLHFVVTYKFVHNE
jgi:hypothetical protein